MLRQSRYQRVRTWLTVTSLAIALAGCETTRNGPTTLASDNTAPTASIQPSDPDDIQYLPSNEPLKAGLEQFKKGNYGLSERYFRDAVEKNPRDAPAWIGLAASYDRLARYELADRAYASAIKLDGETTEILNNRGYSYMLRGNYKAAYAKLQQALKKDPGNPTVLNNIELLKSAERSERVRP
jgi:Flp pilus assembly protein TadD